MTHKSTPFYNIDENGFPLVMKYTFHFTLPLLTWNKNFLVTMHAFWKSIKSAIINSMLSGWLQSKIFNYSCILHYLPNRICLSMHFYLRDMKHNSFLQKISALNLSKYIRVVKSTFLWCRENASSGIQLIAYVKKLK
jgi:hypothetical protein